MTVKPKKTKLAEPSKQDSRQQKVEEGKEETRGARIKKCLDSKLHRAFSHFLNFSITSFEKVNKALQTRQPQIHTLRSTLLDLLKMQMAAFVKPSVLTACQNVRYVNYKDQKNHKEDVDISIGSSTMDIVEAQLEGQDLITFFSSVKNYYIRACDYIIGSFPLEDDILMHAQVADTAKSQQASFSSVRFFLKSFPILLLRRNNESHSEACDLLEQEFTCYTLEKFNFADGMPADQQWFQISQVKNAMGNFKFQRLAYFMLGILTIPHSNAECERLFSQVRKNKTDFRGSMSNDMLGSLLLAKSDTTDVPCYATQFTPSFLNKAKAATSEELKKK